MKPSTTKIELPTSIQLRKAVFGGSLKILATPLVLSMLAFCLSGCASVEQQKPLSSGQALAPGKAYLFGRFHKERTYKLPLVEQVRLWLQLTHLDSDAKINLKLTKDNDVYAVAVEPGKYVISNVLVDFGRDAFMSADCRPAPFKVEKLNFMQNPFNARPGKAYYIGDFHGVTERRSGFWMSSAHVFAGGLHSVAWNPVETTEEFKQRFPQFAEMEALPAWMRP